VAACRAIGASLQAAVLCQSLPQPDHESAFHILQENPLVVARDAAAYFDCVWEVSMMCYSSWRLYTTTKQLFAIQHVIDYLHKVMHCLSTASIFVQT
jgi:hypothetical protein